MFKYTPRQIPQNIMVIGCGGTGSRLVPLLTQFLRSITREHSPTGWLENPNVYLMDFDTVEQKNLLRQNFIAPDVGKNKAVVLAQRYSRAYGINVIPVNTKINSSTTWGELSKISESPTLNGTNMMFIMCVDSVKARQDILALINKVRVNDISQTPFVIDAGNENNYGQVKFFNLGIAYANGSYIKHMELVNYANVPKMSPVIMDIPIIPFPDEFYRTLQDAPSQGSCADLDQTLAINAAMATSILGVVQNFYYVKPFTHNEVSINLDGGSYTTFNSALDLAKKLSNNTGVWCKYIEGASLLDTFSSKTKKIMDKMKEDSEKAQEEHRKKELKEKELKELKVEGVDDSDITPMPKALKKSPGSNLPGSNLPGSSDKVEYVVRTARSKAKVSSSVPELETLPSREGPLPELEAIPNRASTSAAAQVPF